jgi:hypothetical protein
MSKEGCRWSQVTSFAFTLMDIQADLPQVITRMNDAVDGFKGEIPDLDDRTLMIVKKS